jgi:hypothetical protein
MPPFTRCTCFAVPGSCLSSFHPGRGPARVLASPAPRRPGGPQPAAARLRRGLGGLGGASSPDLDAPGIGRTPRGRDRARPGRLARELRRPRGRLRPPREHRSPPGPARPRSQRESHYTKGGQARMCGRPWTRREPRAGAGPRGPFDGRGGRAASGGRPARPPHHRRAPYDNYRASIFHARLLCGLLRWVPIISHHAIAEWRRVPRRRRGRGEASAPPSPPLLAIADGADAHAGGRWCAAWPTLHAGPHQLWVAPGAEHVGAILHPDYWPVVLAFLDAAGI